MEFVGDDTAYGGTLTIIDSESKNPYILEFQKQAFEAFKTDGGFPSDKNEDWKNIDIDSLIDTPFKQAADPLSPELNSAIDVFVGQLSQSARIVLVNGVMSDILSDTSLLPEEIRFNRFSKLPDEDSRLLERVMDSSSAPQNPFERINGFQFKDGVFGVVPEGIVAERSLHIVSIQASDQPVVSYPNLVITLGERASLSVIVTHVSLCSGVPSLDNSNWLFDISPSARLDYLNLKATRSSANVIDTMQVHIAEKGHFNGAYIVSGGNINRNEVRVALNGEDANSSMVGVGICPNGNKLYTNTTVDLNAPNTESHQFFKSILGPDGVNEYSGLVYVAPDAQQVNSEQLNRNLILDDSARAISRPQLKIYADDVSCTHGATTGQLEDSELLYLMSRGIDRNEATSLLISGFAEEIVDHIKNDRLKYYAEENIRSALMGIKVPT